MGKNKQNCAFCNSEILRHTTKTDTYFCNIKCKSDWQIFQREKLGFTKDWLINQYFVLKKDCNQIAKEIGRNPKAVWDWFNGYGIKINKRGTNYEKNLVLDGTSFKGKKHKQESKEKIRQARIKDGHVPYLNKDGVHWLKGVKGSGTPNYKGGLTPERQSFYSSEIWSESVKAVWKRDNATCQNCGKNHNEKTVRGTFHIHHIISFQIREFRSELSNLVLLCKECHFWVHSKENTEKKFIKNHVKN